MIEIDPSRWKSKVGPPFQHQIEGVKFLISRNNALLADEMGSGKTRQIIDTACELYVANQIDILLVVCPSGVKSTWDKELEVHCWVDYYFDEYWTYSTRIQCPARNNGLHVVVTAYEFLRSPGRLNFLLSRLRPRRFVAVYDESSYVKSRRSEQAKKARDLRRRAKRAYLVNGSPINNSLEDLYTPFAILDKSIIGCRDWYEFRNTYLQMGGWHNRAVVGYNNKEILLEKLKPYIIRRLKEDCLDLPPKIYQQNEVALTPTTWKHYVEMRDEMITWLDEQTPLMTMHAVVKIMRLAQLTCGIASGIQRGQIAQEILGLEYDPNQAEEIQQTEIVIDPDQDYRVISSEKHDYVASWFDERAHEQGNFRAIIWTRFRAEQRILEDLISKKAPNASIYRIYGGQKKPERLATIEAFNQPASRPVVLLGQPKAGGIGLNLQAECSWAVYVSNDYSLLTRQQSEDRIHRSGQRASSVNYLDVLATGPRGQRTIDHVIRDVIRNKEEFAVRTCAYWRTALAAN